MNKLLICVTALTMWSLLMLDGRPALAQSPSLNDVYGPAIQTRPAPPPIVLPPPPPLGWLYGPYTQCADPPRCSTGVVTVGADGLNVRVAPNGPVMMALVNGTPFLPLQRQGDWFLVAPACDLTPTWAWSWTAPAQLFRCWVYF